MDFQEIEVLDIRDIQEMVMEFEIVCITVKPYIL